MDYQSLDILEEKINMAVELIARLREQNHRLKEENGHLRSRMEERELELKTIQEEFQHLSTIKQETQNYQEREKLIKGKVESMLSKLDAVQLTG